MKEEAFRNRKRTDWLERYQKRFRRPQKELLKRAERMNRKRQFRMPMDGKARYDCPRSR